MLPKTLISLQVYVIRSSTGIILLVGCGLVPYIGIRIVVKFREATEVVLSAL